MEKALTDRVDGVRVLGGWMEGNVAEKVWWGVGRVREAVVEGVKSLQLPATLWW